MTVEVMVLVLCNEKVERAQKYLACTIVEKAIQKIRGVESTSFTGNGEVKADITVFANWDESEITERIAEIKRIEGIVDAYSRIVLPA